MSEVARSVTLAELERLFDEVGELDGWDFSAVAIESEPELWDYGDLVRRYLRPSDRVLDIGTGGGEQFLRLADSMAEGIGIDHDPAMIRTASGNLPDSLRDRIRFEVMEGRAMTFDDDEFEVVLDCHAWIEPEQIVRVLRPGGYVIAEVIGGNRNQLIFDAFGWGSNGEYQRDKHAAEGRRLRDTAEIAAEFERLGCRVLATATSNPRAWFQDLESLVFYLKAIPIREPFDPRAHLERFNRYLASSAGPRGYETDLHLELIVARKLA